jgi:hypothetical protein
MSWIGKALGGSGIVAVAASSMTALLVIVGAALLLTLAALWIIREANRTPRHRAAKRIVNLRQAPRVESPPARHHPAWQLPTPELHRSMDQIPRPQTSRRGVPQ